MIQENDIEVNHHIIKEKELKLIKLHCLLIYFDVSNNVLNIMSKNRMIKIQKEISNIKKNMKDVMIEVSTVNIKINQTITPKKKKTIQKEKKTNLK